MPGPLLPGDRVGDQAVDLALVLGAIDLAAVEPDAQLAHLAGLGQRAGAGGREERQVQARLRRLALRSADARADLADLRPLGPRRVLLVERLAGGDRGRPRGKRRGLLARECEAWRQVLALDRVRQEHEAGRRHQSQRPAVIGDPLDPIAHAVECRRSTRCAHP